MLLSDALQFYADVLQAGSPSNKIGSPASLLPTRTTDQSRVPHFWSNLQWALFSPNTPSFLGSTNLQVLGSLDQHEALTQQQAPAPKNPMESISISTGSSTISNHQEHTKTLPSLKFVYQETPPQQHWLQPHMVEEDQGHQGWFDCLPVEAIVLKTPRMTPLMQASMTCSGLVICSQSQSNTHQVNLTTMMGGVYVRKIRFSASSPP